MFFVKKIDIADNERAFLFKNNRFTDVLEPGSYHYYDPFGHVRLEYFDITHNELNHNLGKFLVSTFADKTKDYLQSYQLTDNQVGLLYCDDQLFEIIPPGSFKIYWKGPEKMDLIKIDITDQCQIEAMLLTLLGRGHNADLTNQASQAIYYVEVNNNQVGLLLINGQLEDVLQPGCYGFWKFHRHIEVKQMDLRLQNMEVSGQEILTKDRVSLRLNLSATYQIIDPKLVESQLADFYDFLYREFQLQLREAVGTQTLDQLLSHKDSLNQVIADGIREKVSTYGLAVKSVGVRDIILPGEMKIILNQVLKNQ